MNARIFVAALTAAVGALACGGADSGSSRKGAGGSAGTNVGQPGCTASPDCGACADACSACMCQFDDAVMCQVSCGGGSGGTAGVGGAGGSGVGGSGVGGSGAVNQGGGAGFYPTPDWPMGTPEEEGLSAAQLDVAQQYSQSIGGRCLLVVRNGKLVYERYYNGGGLTVQQRSWSIAKTFAGALVGVAITRGEIKSVDDPAANYIPAWQGDPQKQLITIRHILDMVSGLTHDLISDNTWTIFTSDMTAEAINNTVSHPPDAHYVYSNHTVQVLEEVLSNATGMDVEEYAKKYLWGPLGFQPNTFWERDGAGNVAPFMNVNATCRDFARLGYFYLHGGHWDGVQVVNQQYIQESLNPSSSVNAGHSHYVWLNGNMPYINSTDETSTPKPHVMFPEAPMDLFSYQGIGQNFVDTVPSTQTIYIHTRPAPHDPFTNFIIDLAGTMDKLFRDGDNIEHKELLKLLVPAG